MPSLRIMIGHKTCFNVPYRREQSGEIANEITRLWPSLAARGPVVVMAEDKNIVYLCAWDKPRVVNQLEDIL